MFGFSNYSCDWAHALPLLFSFFPAGSLGKKHDISGAYVVPLNFQSVFLGSNPLSPKASMRFSGAYVVPLNLQSVFLGSNPLSPKGCLVKLLVFTEQLFFNNQEGIRWPFMYHNKKIMCLPIHC